MGFCYRTALPTPSREPGDLAIPGTPLSGSEMGGVFFDIRTSDSPGSRIVNPQAIGDGLQRLEQRRPSG